MAGNGREVLGGHIRRDYLRSSSVWWRQRGVLRTAKGVTGLYTPKSKMNQFFEHDLVIGIPCASYLHWESSMFSFWKLNPTEVSCISQVQILSHFTLGDPRPTFSHAHPPPIQLRGRACRTNLTPHPHPALNLQTGSSCRPQNLCTSNVGLSSPSSTTNSPLTVVWLLP